MDDEKPSRLNLKRSLPQFIDDDDPSHRPPLQKKARFPKGKKVKRDDEYDKIEADGIPEMGPRASTDPRLAAKERAMRRNQIMAELFSDQSNGVHQEIYAAEEDYEDNGIFEDDGTVIEPFNLKQEREEGYFDAAGNFVEYAKEKNEIEDAWLDSVVVDSRFPEKDNGKANEEGEDVHNLSPEEIGKMKRRIADLLQPGETVLQALRRLKGNTNGKKERMPEVTKRMFDQLTEDSMKLMENGDYNVYHEEREVFVREAEGYERIVRAREGTPMNSSNGTLDFGVGEDMFSGGTQTGAGPLPDFNMKAGQSNLSTSTKQVSSGGGGGDDTFDMFGEEDENTTSSQSSHGGALGSQPASESLVPLNNPESNEVMGTQLGSDYVYDESSGYYYSSSLGYYYDPTSGLYCCATTGKWYLFNEQTCTYDEVAEAAAADAS